MKNKLPKEFDGEFFTYPDSTSIWVRLKNGDIQRVIDVRGWGYLTGGGALNLPEEEAVEIQDSFLKWATECLNNSRAETKQSE